MSEQEYVEQGAKQLIEMFVIVYGSKEAPNKCDEAAVYRDEEANKGGPDEGNHRIAAKAFRLAAQKMRDNPPEPAGWELNPDLKEWI